MSFKELFVSDFPLYCVLPLGKGEFCITGGGGKSKTGVPNAIEICTLCKDKTNGSLGSKVLFRHDLGSDVIMNMVSSPNDLCTLAVSIDSSCQLMQIKKKGLAAKGKISSIVELSNNSELFVKTLQSVRTDFGEKESYQKVVCFSHNGSMLVTGGMDAIVRVWKTSTLKELYKLRGHKDEIEGISCHPTKPEVVSVCRGGEANVWDLNSGKQLKHFNWGSDRQPKYRFRSCCFTPASENDASTSLFTINVPSKWNRRTKRDCFLVKWDPLTWKPITTSKVGKELLSALAVSLSGKRVGVGSTEGSVTIYTSDLKLLQKVPKVHSFSVTSLCFVIDKADPPNKTGPPNELIISVSADRTCCVTKPKEKGAACNWTITLFCLLPFLFFMLSIVVLFTVVI